MDGLLRRRRSRFRAQPPQDLRTWTPVDCQAQSPFLDGHGVARARAICTIDIHVGVTTAHEQCLQFAQFGA
jgi:hypothetical protein